jgi:hypothetical protein
MSTTTTTTLLADIIVTAGNYGFGANWSLVVADAEDTTRKRNFFLGQDAKVCIRILDIRPETGVAKYGRDFNQTSVRVAWAEAILIKLFGSLDEAASKIWDAQDWDLACV